MATLVGSLTEAMPSGVTVTPGGRIFLCFPRWFDRIDFTLGELLPDGTVEPFPNGESNRLDLCDPAHHLLSVQSVNADDDRTLWVLDTGRPYFTPALPRAAKLVAVDLATRKTQASYEIPYGIARLGTYLNDVRIDPVTQTAYITDSATITNSAIIVVDLATGRKLRRLDGDISVQPAKGFTPSIEGRPLRLELPFGCVFPYQNGADGIALSPDRRTLYYCPLSSDQLYSVDAHALADPALPDDELRRTIVHLGTKGFSDGLECDTAGRVYASDLEHGCVLRSLDGGRTWNVFESDPRMLWTDTLAVAADGYLYFTSNQINRLAVFNGGIDRRKPPYYVFKALM